MAPHFDSGGLGPGGKRGQHHNNDQTEMTDMTEINVDTSVTPVTNTAAVPHHAPSDLSSNQQQAHATLHHKTSYTSETSTASTTSSLLSNGHAATTTTTAATTTAAAVDAKSGLPLADKMEVVETGLSTNSDDADFLKDEHGRELSPIPEVAAVVANTDDPTIPCLTFRFWVMGLISILALSFVNQVW
ncbi:hypothetical protein BGZ83_008102 [Gryganskiella cystojenkinii]|nr:hypothetical protein BGZ83_008102 [Gryganskiella cystojenkinii]